MLQRASDALFRLRLALCVVALFLFRGCADVCPAQSFKAVWHCTNFIAGPVTNAPVTLTPLLPFRDYPNATLVDEPMFGVTDSNGVVTFTNLAAGYSYRFELSTSARLVRRTNGFPLGLTGTVAAEPYFGAWLPGMTLFAYVNTNLINATISPLGADMNAAGHAFTNASTVSATNAAFTNLTVAETITANSLAPFDNGASLTGVGGVTLPFNISDVTVTGSNGWLDFTDFANGLKAKNFQGALIGNASFATNAQNSAYATNAGTATTATNLAGTIAGSQINSAISDAVLPPDVIRSNTASQTIFPSINASGGFANIGSWNGMDNSYGVVPGGGSANQPIWIFGGNTNFTHVDSTNQGADFGPQMGSLGPRIEASFVLVTTNGTRGYSTLSGIKDTSGNQLYCDFNHGSIGMENDTANGVPGNNKGVFAVVNNGYGFAVLQSVVVGGVSGNYEHIFVTNGVTYFPLWFGGVYGPGVTNNALAAFRVVNDGTSGSAGNAYVYSNFYVGGGALFAGPNNTALTRYDTGVAVSYLNGADMDPTSTVQATNFVSTVPYGAVVQFQNNGCQFRSSDGRLQLGTTSGQEPFIANPSGYLLTISEGGNYGAMRIQQNNINFGWLNDAGGNIGSSGGGGYAKRPGNVYLKSFLEIGNTTTAPTASDIASGGTALWSSNGVLYATCTANGTTSQTTQLATHP